MKTMLKPKNNIEFNEEKCFAIVLTEEESEWLTRDKENIMHQMMYTRLQDVISSKKKRYKKQVLVFDSENELIR
jgi:hypothetical protein